MTISSTPVLVEALRGGIVESFHRGSVAVVDANGAVHTAWGDIDRPIFPRSAVKLLQALPLITSGAADDLKLSDEQLALACSSHGGEPEHVATAAAMLAQAGVDPCVLECGAGLAIPTVRHFSEEVARRGALVRINPREPQIGDSDIPRAISISSGAAAALAAIAAAL